MGDSTAEDASVVEPPPEGKRAGNRISARSSSSAELDQDRDPARIGPYRIERRLGVGGMGKVYRAFDESLERPVAIKLVRPEILLGRGSVGSARRRFRSEARAVAGLDHPNIIRIYHILETLDGDAIVMEYAEGLTLSERLATGPLQPIEAVDICRQIALGLAEAHAKGLVHRDLKAANVLVDGKGRVRILDFGLAKPTEPGIERFASEIRAPSGGLETGADDGGGGGGDQAPTERGDGADVIETSTGVVLGSYDAMSPEQAQGRSVGPASDLFSLGLLLFALLTGRKPFWTGSVVTSLTRLCTEPHPPLRQLEPDLPGSLVRLVDQLLEKRPRDRPVDASWVADALAAIARELGREAERADGASGEPSGSPATDPSSSPATLRAVLVADLPARERLWDELPEREAARMSQELEALWTELEDEYQAVRTEELEQQWMLFELPLASVRFALDYHSKLARLASESGVDLAARVAIHFGEIVVRRVSSGTVDPDVVPFEVQGPAKAVALGMLGLCRAGQTLISRGAFDLARNALWHDSNPSAAWSWLAHGEYRLPDVDDPVGLFEVGVEGRSPLMPPDVSSAIRAFDSGSRETILGWRPAVGQKVSGRSNWILESKLGEGGFGEVWLARHAKINESRVFKFCFESNRLRALQREITLFRLLEGELGRRPDIARILDWNFDQPPYFIESEYTEGGNLKEWSEARGGGSLSLGLRLELIAQVADALAAAHSVGVLHKDVKPANVLIRIDDTGRPGARLADFGIGAILDQGRLRRAGITVLGLTRSLDRSDGGSSQRGTRLYQAPELMEGKAATVQADIFALGVMLYQFVVEDFGRALGPGWERDVEDPLLRADIAAAVDVSPERRLDHAGGLAERLRSLEARRSALESERVRREEAERVRSQLEVARRRRKLWVAALLFLTLFGGLMAIQASRIAREVERANREAETASTVSDFLVDLFRSSDPWQRTAAEELTVRTLLERGAEKVGEELAGQPLVQARLMDTIGRIYVQLAAYDEGRALLERSLELRRGLQGDDHPDVSDTLLYLGWAGWHDGNGELALERLERALHIRERHWGVDSEKLPEVLSALATVHGDSGRVPEALAVTRRGLAILDSAAEPNPGLRGHLLLSQANGLEASDRLEEAESKMQEVVRIWSEHYGAEHPILSEIYADLAHLSVRLGKFEAARPLLLRSRTILEEHLGPEHPFVAATWRVEADLLSGMGLYEESANAYSVARRIVRASQLGNVARLELGFSAGLAKVRWRQGRLDSAARHFAEMEMYFDQSEIPLVPPVDRIFEDYLRFLEEVGDRDGAARIRARLAQSPETPGPVEAPRPAEVGAADSEPEPREPP